MRRLRLLDLYCGDGGAGEGYRRAGFDVVGVDIEHHRYPCGKFVQGDAMEALRMMAYSNGPLGFDAIHASPPCQGETTLRAVQRGRDYDRLLVPTLELLSLIGLPWVVENVDNAEAPRHLYKTRLCGSSFGLGVRRHRWFWTNFAVLGQPCDHKAQGQPLGVYGLGGGGQMTRGRKATREEAPTAMGIDWMRHEDLVQAIPPAYTEYLGQFLLAAVSEAA